VRERPNRPQRGDAEGPVVLAVRIQPRASRNGIVRREDGTFKIRLTAPPVDGAANEALIKFLSDTLNLSKSQVEIVSGQTSREKRIKIIGMSESDVIRLLNNAGQ